LWFVAQCLNHYATACPPGNTNSEAWRGECNCSHNEPGHRPRRCVHALGNQTIAYYGAFLLLPRFCEFGAAEQQTLPKSWSPGAGEGVGLRRAKRSIPCEISNSYSPSGGKQSRDLTKRRSLKCIYSLLSGSRTLVIFLCLEMKQDHAFK
jgi:hypothetical protein